MRLESGLEGAGMEGVRSAGTKFRGLDLTSVVSSWI